MYQILLGDLDGKNEILYYPGDKEFNVFETTLEIEVGKAGTFEFVVPKTNPLNDQIKQSKIITILRDDVEFWRGEIQETTKDFSGNISVYCVEDLAWLGYESMRPAKITHESYAQRFQTALETYNNNQIKSERRFEIGYITNVISSNPCNWETDYEDTILDSIRNCIAKDDGYVRVRRSGGKRYIDIVKLSDYGIQATQTIRFAENLLDYVEEMEMSNFTNVLFPYGEELENEEIYEGLNKRIEGTPLSNEASIEIYGRHARSVVFETDSLARLDALAQAYITRYSQPQLKFELDAIDLADISNDTHFNIGDSIKVIAEPFGIDQWIYLTKQILDLQDVSRNKFTLSSYISKGRSLTSQTVDVADLVNDIPSKNSLIESAKRNTLNLLEGGEGGFVTYKFNPDGQPIEIRITDNIEESESLKKWIWNENGLGYMTRENTTEEFKPSDVSVALTMDGQILARAGVIGSDAEAWQIGPHSIFNGTTAISDVANDGLYIGTDGIINVATGALGYKVYTKIQGGQIESTSRIRASSISAGALSVDAGESINCSIKGYVNGEEKYIGFNFVNGILTGVS